jgi:hypothetical protein
MSCAAYAVLRHRLMDIEVAISRGIVYSALFPLLAGVYVATGEALEQITQEFVPSTSWVGSIVAALVVSLLFEPAKRTLERRVDYYFIRDDGVVESLRRLEKVPALVVAEDLPELRRLHGELDAVIRGIETRQPAAPEPATLERAGRG